MYAASIDFERGIMRPSFKDRVYYLNKATTPTNVVGSSDGIQHPLIHNISTYQSATCYFFVEHRSSRSIQLPWFHAFNTIK
jgi:hypothetical protein